MECKASCLLGRYSTTELSSTQPVSFLYIFFATILVQVFLMFCLDRIASWLGFKHCEFEDLTYFIYQIVGLIPNRNVWMNTAGARTVFNKNTHLVMSLISSVTLVAFLWYNVTSNSCSMVLRHPTMWFWFIFWSLCWFWVPCSIPQNHLLLHSLRLSCTLPILGASSTWTQSFFFLLTDVLLKSVFCLQVTLL